MKIGFFTDNYLPSNSGMQISIEAFRKSLEKTGNEVYVFAPYFPRYRDKNPRVFRFHSLKVTKKPELRFAFPFLATNNLKEVLKIKLDVVHAHDPFSLGFLGKLMASYQKIPFLYSHHTDLSEYAKFYVFKEKYVSPYLAKMLTASFSNLCQAIIAPSLKMKKDLIECGVKKPVHILPTGVNLKVFEKSSQTKRDFRKKLGISQEAKILLFVGRMAKEKNIKFLIQSFREILKKTKETTLLFIAGDGPDLESLRQTAHSLKLNHFVHFTGYIPYREIPNYYKMADLFVFASLTDTQGIVVLEAVSSGLPVVALKDEAFGQFVIPNKNGFLIKEHSPKFFAKKVLELLENQQLYEKFSLASSEIARQFSEKKQAEKLLAIYKKLIKKREI